MQRPASGYRVPRNQTSLVSRGDVTKAWLLIVLFVSLLLVMCGVLIVDRWMPLAASIPIPSGAVQFLRRPGEIYVETWFLGAPHVMVTVSIEVLWSVLVVIGWLLVLVEYCLLWQWWRQQRER